MNVLIAVDLSDATFRIMQVAKCVMRAMSVKAWILHVAEAEPDLVGFDAGPDVVRDQVAQEYRDEHHSVQALAETLRADGIDATALLIRGPIIETVLQEAENLKADLIIVGSHGFGPVYDLLIGSSSRGILKHSVIPVLVVPTRD